MIYFFYKNRYWHLLKIHYIILWNTLHETRDLSVLNSEKIYLEKTWSEKIIVVETKNLIKTDG